MQVILHIGAHRCATTTFQYYMRENANRLSRDRVGFWGPRRTRNGLFAGIVLPIPGVSREKAFHRGAGRVQLALAKAQATGLDTLVVSDENTLGTIRENLRLGELYSGIGERLARYHAAFDGAITDIVLNIRSIDTYWTSALGYSVGRGFGVPKAALIDRLVASPRSWRDVVTDVACAAPGVRIWVLPFESYAGRPDAQLELMTGLPASTSYARERKNATLPLEELRALLPSEARGQLPEGTGRWQPLTARQSATLREAYADDLMWLAGGADGLAWLAEEAATKMAGKHLRMTDRTRGSTDDSQGRRMAQAR